MVWGGEDCFNLSLLTTARVVRVFLNVAFSMYGEEPHFVALLAVGGLDYFLAYPWRSRANELVAFCFSKFCS